MRSSDEDGALEVEVVFLDLFGILADRGTASAQMAAKKPSVRYCGSRAYVIHICMHICSGLVKHPLISASYWHAPI